MTPLHLHILCSLASYFLLLAACASGVCYLLVERQLKHKTIGRLAARLPSLAWFDRFNLLALAAGFLLLTVGLGSGMAERGLEFGAWWGRDPKELASFAMWLAYGGIVLLRWWLPLRGHRFMAISVLGFSLVLFTALGVRYLLPSWHAY